MSNSESTGPTVSAQFVGTALTLDQRPASHSLFLVYAPFWAGLHNAGASGGPSWPLSLIANAASILGALLPTSIANTCQGAVKDRLRFG